MNLIEKKSILERETFENIKGSKAHNTLRAYKSDFDDFRNFCKIYNFISMPANTKTVSMYLTHLSKKAKYSTIKRRLAAIKVIHNISNNYIDIKHPIINENLIGIKRKIGIFQKGKTPLTLMNLKKIVYEIDKENNNNKIRDKAIILLGFAGAFRRSELVSILYEDLDFVEEGVKIFIRKSKTDQSGEGMLKAIPYFSNKELCPVFAIKEWIDSLDKIRNNKFVFNMSDKNVALIIKKYTAKIGLDSSQFAGHSLRSGFATVTAEMGAEEREIMSMTGHKSVQMVRRYIHNSNLFKNNALNKLKL
tara:strand:- start:84 stop:998 length:915 start_codon:yes stop_codon:yes gene_type:complete